LVLYLSNNAENIKTIWERKDSLGL
jgi:hypothetical protein